MKYDMTYCNNNDCPFEDCSRHPINTKSPGIYSVANFAATCRRYITWLVNEVSKDELD